MSSAVMAMKAMRAAEAATEFDGFTAERAEAEPAFLVDVDGFEGPLDLLLELARRQKVDLARISMLELANQYLQFVEAARQLRLELAADYLVMAAWLAYLKSRLLLPDPPRPEALGAADLAEALARRLRRLEDIRWLAQMMLDRPRLGRDVFARGAPEGVAIEASVVYEASLFDLLSTYAAQAQRRARAFVRMKPREVWSLAEARDALIGVAASAREFEALETWLLALCPEPKMRRSARASTFAAALEMAREGLIEIRQEGTFAPIYIRANPEAAQPAA